MNVIHSSMPRPSHSVAVLLWIAVSGVTPQRMWWKLDGEPMWADPIEAEWERVQRGGKLMYDFERKGTPLQP